MGYNFWADVIVVVHALYVGFVVIGELLILVGLALRWKWVRNPTFRWIHLLAIAIVGVEAVFGWTCPLTSWEDDLRELAGTPNLRGDSFLARVASDVLWFDDVELWVFTVKHISF